MFSKMQCPNSRSMLRKRRQMRCLLCSLARMFQASLAGLRKTSVSAICFTLNPNKGHHLRLRACSSIGSKATWVMVIHQFYRYIWHLPQIRTLTPLHHECEDWYLESRCSMQYALCQKWLISRFQETVSKMAPTSIYSIGQERSTWTRHLTSLQPGMVPDRKAWRNQTTLTGLAEFG